jgi:hypothetical protein
MFTADGTGGQLWLAISSAVLLAGMNLSVGAVSVIHAFLQNLVSWLGAIAQGAQAESDKTKPLDIPSVPQLQAMLWGKIWDDTINTLVHGSRNRRVGKKLKNLILLST